MRRSILTCVTRNLGLPLDGICKITAFCRLFSLGPDNTRAYIIYVNATYCIGNNSGIIRGLRRRLNVRLNRAAPSNGISLVTTHYLKTYNVTPTIMFSNAINNGLSPRRTITGIGI